jgi:hypothetical protein
MQAGRSLPGIADTGFLPACVVLIQVLHLQDAQKGTSATVGSTSPVQLKCLFAHSNPLQPPTQQNEPQKAREECFPKRIQGDLPMATARQWANVRKYWAERDPRYRQLHHKTRFKYYFMVC